MNPTRFFLSAPPSGANSLRGLSTVLVAALALSFGPPAFAQESEDEERSARVIVLGDVLGDGPIEVQELLQDLEVPENADRARVLSANALAHVWPTLLHPGGTYLGVELVNLNEPLRAHFGVPEGSGVLVSNVVDDSPAARAGIQVGDIIARFDGEDVTSSRKLTTMVRKAEADDPADLEVWRDGKVETVSTTLEERPRPDVRARSFYFTRGREDLDGDGEVDVFIGPDNLEGLQEKIQEYFDGDEWKERHERMQRFLHERRPDMKALEERLETLKERLAELENRLDERGLDEGN